MSVTDLEGAALATIACRGTATSYAVAKTFAESPSEFWSGSQGAVYPLIKRLAARGMLSSKRSSTGKRSQFNYSLTAKGRRELESWLLDAKRASQVGYDPLRTRLTYLELVPPERRKQFLAEVKSIASTMAAQPVFDGWPTAQRVHETWIKARSAWLAMIDFF